MNNIAFGSLTSRSNLYSARAQFSQASAIQLKQLPKAEIMADLFQKNINTLDDK